MENILLTINVILAIILVILILIQKSEGGALGIGVSQENFKEKKNKKTKIVIKSQINSGLKNIKNIKNLIFA